MASFIRKFVSELLPRHHSTTPTEAAAQSVASVATGAVVGFVSSRRKEGLDAGKVPLDGLVGLGLTAFSAVNHGAVGALAHRLGHDLLVIAGFRKGEHLTLPDGGKAKKAAHAKTVASGGAPPTVAAAPAAAALPAAPAAAPAPAGEITDALDAIHMGEDPIVTAARHL